MSIVAKFPQSSDIKVDKARITENKRKLKQHMKNLSKIQNELFKLSGTNVDIEDLPKSDEHQKIWKTLEQNFNNTMPFIE